MKGILQKEKDRWVVVYKSLGKDHTLPVADSSSLIGYNLDKFTFVEGKPVEFEIGDQYVEPSGDIHSNRGAFREVAKIKPGIEKIKIGEGCFGSWVEVDDQPLFYVGSHEDLTKEESLKINHKKLKLIDELKSILPILSPTDFRIISEIITQRWINDEKQNYINECDQCGNYNWNETYYRYEKK